MELSLREIIEETIYQTRLSVSTDAEIAELIEKRLHSHYSGRVLTEDVVKNLLIKRFAQTVEYGGMCQDCCSAINAKDSVKVGCEMVDHDLNPNDYCPQQIECINETVKELMGLLEHQHLTDSLVKEAAVKKIFETLEACQSLPCDNMPEYMSITISRRAWQVLKENNGN